MYRRAADFFPMRVFVVCGPPLTAAVRPLLPTPQYMEVIKGAAIKLQFPASYRYLFERIETRVFDQ
jgi:hypothetical protein